MRRLALFLVLCSAANAGYLSKATVNFAGASTSTQTNITLVFSFSDAKLATVANGGQIQNLCSRNSTSIPCDFVFTNDTTCATLTGSYTWGFDGDYSATAGTGHGWIMIPSYTTSGVTPTVCINNTAVTTYQGGAAGAEYDSNTVGVWHLADGTTLSGTAYKGTNCTLANTPTAAAGKIDGGMQTLAASAQACKTTAPTPMAAAFTVRAWVKITTTTGDKSFFGNDSSGGVGGLELRVNGTTQTITMLRSQTAGLWTSTGTVTNNTFAYIMVTGDALGNYVLYRNNSTAETFNVTMPFLASNPIWLGANSFAGENFTGIVDEMRIDSTQRSATWAATEYANQNSPPAIGAFTSLATFVANPSVIVVF